MHVQQHKTSFIVNKRDRDHPEMMNVQASSTSRAANQNNYRELLSKGDLFAEVGIPRNCAHFFL
jgi:hypothetical protein